MKLPKVVYRYIEYELFHYEEYKKELLLERERILESYSSSIGAEIRGSQKTDATQRKVINLMESTAVLSLERKIRAIDYTLATLSKTHAMLFNALYNQKRTDIYKICNELSISKETYARYKQHIIHNVGKELGIFSGIGV